MNGNLALRLGRPDAAMRGRRPANGAGPAELGLGAYATAGALSAGATAGLTTGLVSSTILALIVLGLVGYYVWTRGHQA